MDLKVAIAQIKTVTGDLSQNTNKILEGIKKAVDENADVIIFPELAVSGYCCGLLFQQKHFIEDNLKFLYKKILPAVPDNLIAIVGFIDLLGTRRDGTPDIQNSLMVIQDGIVLGKYAKILLANGGHHNDRRFFTPGNSVNVISAKVRGKNLNIGTVICEDTWNQDHHRDIVSESVEKGAEIIVSINQSYFCYGKQEIRRHMYKNHAQKHGVPVISVNNVGVGDTAGDNYIIYDGGSYVVNSEGDICYEAKRFEEDFKVVDIGDNRIMSRVVIPAKLDEIYDAIVFAQKHIFYDLGFERAIIACSGGLDSSVALALVTAAMGKENVIALSMPSQYNSDTTKSNAQQLCDALGVKLYWEPIQEIQDAFVDAHTKTFGDVTKLNKSTFDAVGRTVCGIAASQFTKAGLVSTGNHTENVLNWFSWHDISTAAVYAPLGDLTKVEIFALADYISKKAGKEIIPVNLFDGTTQPGPELSDAIHASWDYSVVSGICALLIRERKCIDEIVQSYNEGTLPLDYFPVNHEGKTIYQLVTTSEGFEKITRMCFNRQKASVYKLSQSCAPLILSHYARGFSNQESIINKYTQDYKF